MKTARLPSGDQDALVTFSGVVSAGPVENLICDDPLLALSTVPVPLKLASAVGSAMNNAPIARTAASAIGLRRTASDMRGTLLDQRVPHRPTCTGGSGSRRHRPDSRGTDRHRRPRCRAHRIMSAPWHEVG